MSCSTTTTEWSAEISRTHSAVCAVSASVIPATGSSTSSSFGFLRQQHADFQPLLLAVREVGGDPAAIHRSTGFLCRMLSIFSAWLSANFPNNVAKGLLWRFQRQ